MDHSFSTGLHGHGKQSCDQAKDSIQKEATSNLMITKLEELETTNRDILSTYWQELYSIAPPKNLSVQMMQKFIAFEFQSKRSNGLTQKSKRKINQLQKPVGQKKSTSNQLKIGAQILRDWNGVTHKIEVTDKGFLWKGDAYKSLTAIAKLITGTHWSGPRFFGLNTKVKPTNG